MKNIKWKFIAINSMPGLLHGVLSIFGMVEGWEVLLWSIFGIYAVFSTVTTYNEKIFLHGLLTGLAITLWTGWIQALFLDMYLKNNPDYLSLMNDGFNYRLFTWLFTPVFGILYGSAIGGLSIAARKVFKVKSE